MAAAPWCGWAGAAGLVRAPGSAGPAAKATNGDSTEAGSRHAGNSPRFGVSTDEAEIPTAVIHTGLWITGRQVETTGQAVRDYAVNTLDADGDIDNLPGSFAEDAYHPAGYPQARHACFVDNLDDLTPISSENTMTLSIPVPRARQATRPELSTAIWPDHVDSTGPSQTRRR